MKSEFLSFNQHINWEHFSTIKAATVSVNAYCVRIRNSEVDARLVYV